MTVRYVGKCGNTFTTTLKDDKGRVLTKLIWGDPVHVEQEAGQQVKVRARGWSGWVDAAALDDVSLLEVYIIDVGQGDGILVKTPDAKWHLIDAGISSASQMTKKGAANFLRWKFQEDLLQQTVSLANVIVTHPDADHYGGLIDVFSGTLADGRTFPVTVDNFYHNGLGRFAAAPKLGQTQTGEVASFPFGEHGIKRRGTFITELLGDADSFRNPPHKFSTTFQRFADLVAQVPRHVQRLSQADGYLPGYAPGENTTQITVLGPIAEDIGKGRVGLRKFGNTESKTVNGHSILLRLDFGQTRLLLAGDLNLPAQQLLLSYHDAVKFASDVFKACHHGSEDISMEFLQAAQACVTVISSGDNENYAHPRPLAIGAAGRYGREAVDVYGQTMPPLIYSTELARSVKLAYAEQVRVRQSADSTYYSDTPLRNVQLRMSDWKRFRALTRTSIAADLIYGLVNVRTDGQYILCGTMLEKGNDFDIKVFRVGVDS